ncbi:hypothetical protein [Hyphomicrobium sulfonivorans]|uniref:Uncharacterized protein n=1 Tax=Hyphomicrobium sulfonivorans TaxID=121290 RepID=A0A125NTU5_HYPSL|nr:hypothetical protein [Hyphomicrobium sulfonivorans]KWT64574.1 hypothetical protein APY04_3242 [Hyphomicrobium sulfonivorans]MBI1650414.1 hypothetical protein [Hyphomicrobium sulfonivorans]NSL72225.1 hypothetical protein [Hyphomicrobium sulfonivorans]
MKRTTATLVAAIAGTLIAAGMTSAIPAFAADDDKHWYFDVENDSNGTVNEFRTQEDGEWSENWLSNRLEPGDKIKLDFETDEGQCEVRTQIHLTDGTYFDAPVDYCKAKTLVIQNNTLRWK